MIGGLGLVIKIQNKACGRPAEPECAKPSAGAIEAE